MKSRTAWRVKRWLDCVIAAFGLIAFAPLFVYCAYRARRIPGGPVIFRQIRPGLNGELFTMYKFRTMTNETDAEGRLLPDIDRLTGDGNFLRRTSLDELPELWNVLIGDMSLVGPRPLLKEYLDHYTPQQMRRHEVRPGITGLAQVSGRNDLPWDQRFELDVWYIDHWSLALDARILARTFLKVLKRESISAPGLATVSRFDEPPQALR